MTDTVYLLDLLNDVAEFLEDYADADGGPDGYKPNKAMSLGLRVEDEIERLKQAPETGNTPTTRKGSAEASGKPGTEARHSGPDYHDLLRDLVICCDQYDGAKQASVDNYRWALTKARDALCATDSRSILEQAKGILK